MARVLLFGPLRDLAGWRERDLEPPPASLYALRDLLAAEDADLGAALLGPGVQIALDQVLVRGDAALTARSEVAFLPPMSGG
jgi:molybdopterin synthase sulfur carrier subunit